MSIFFDSEGFIASKDASSTFFYRELTRTLSFYEFKSDISFTPESLADMLGFFADCCRRVNPKLIKDEQRLIERNPKVNDQTVVTYLLTTANDKEEASAFDYSNQPHTFPRLKSETTANVIIKLNNEATVDEEMANAAETSQKLPGDKC